MPWQNLQAKIEPTATFGYPIAKSLFLIVSVVGMLGGVSMVENKTINNASRS